MNISVANDFTLEQQRERKILIGHQKILKSKNIAVYVRDNKLYYNNKQYDVDTIKDILNLDMSGVLLVNSARGADRNSVQDGNSEVEEIAAFYSPVSRKRPRKRGNQENMNNNKKSKAETPSVTDFFQKRSEEINTD